MGSIRTASECLTCQGFGRRFCLAWPRPPICRKKHASRGMIHALEWNPAVLVGGSAQPPGARVLLNRRAPQTSSEERKRFADLHE